jgi:hypothetical protein
MALRRTLSASLLTAATIGLVSACSTPPPKDEDDISIPLADTTVTAKAPPPVETSSPDEISQDTKDQIKVALRRGGEKAAQCNKAANANVVGEGQVEVVVDGKAGKVVDAIVGAPFAGTPVENCIKRSFVGEYALTFSGQLTIPYSVKLAPNSSAAPPPKKK